MSLECLVSNPLRKQKFHQDYIDHCNHNTFNNNAFSHQCKQLKENLQQIVLCSIGIYYTWVEHLIININKYMKIYSN